MGGVYDAASDAWSGPNYMPIGGQYLMAKNDSSTKLSSSFCGNLDGQGHFIYNVYCERHCSNGNYGDGSSVGIIGRLGVHDADLAEIRPTNPSVRNLAVTGYIHANRSVGGVVGKCGKTTFNSGDESVGCIIENCANFASVTNTDAKGCGGIVGAAWNGGVVRNCYNAGNITTSYACPTGGVCGSNEISIENCYNIGVITAPRDSFAMAIGTNNGGAPAKSCVKNCWYLEGCAPGGGYYDSRGAVNSGELSAEELKGMATALGSAFAPDDKHINGGYPVLNWMKELPVLLAPNEPAWTNPYSDVASGAWYYENVKYVDENKLFDATGNNTFSPDAPMTRAMLASALYRMAGGPKSQGIRSTPFADVAPSAGYADSVAWCYFTGIVNGVDGASFAPNASITREQIVTMFYRYAEKVAHADMSPRDELGAFGDANKLAQWSKEQMQWAVAAGRINGTTSATISPQGTATRAQTAAMVQRLAAFIV